MKRIAVMACAVVVLGLSSGTCHASWGHLFYSGYQPWWNVFAKRYKCLTPEEERLQKFWHDYYDAMKNFYKSMDAIDWVAYYKNHGYQINNGCGPAGCGPMGMGCGRINYAPVFVSPSFQWSVPGGMAGGPPVGMPHYMGGPSMMMAPGPQGGPVPGHMPGPGGQPVPPSGPLPAPTPAGPGQ
ncbi:MAG: hypothetical protein U0736_11905 [Gemmataceae bacterium]